MNRAVYIGGFGNGLSSAATVAEALAKHYDEVDAFTFADAMENQQNVRRAMKGVDVYTHSAGMLAVRGVQFARLEAFGAPLPTSVPHLLGKTAVKTLRMHTPGTGIRVASDIRAVLNYDLSATAELAAHPVANLRHLGRIARFNAVDSAIAAHLEGAPVRLTYTHGDEYFTLSQGEADRATAAGVAVTQAPGIHDELIIRPEATLRLIQQDA